MRPSNRRSRRGQMAVEMALLLPVYFLFMFMVFVYADWFRVVHRLDVASNNLARGEGEIDQSDVNPLLQPMERFGTLQGVTQPNFGDDDGTFLGFGDIADLGQIRALQSVGKCNENGKGIDSADDELAMMAFMLDRGIRRSSNRAQVSFRYDNHAYWDMYDSSYFKPQPTLTTSASSVHPRVMKDTTRTNGNWYGHPIEGVLSGEFGAARFAAMTGPYKPVGHNFLLGNAYYMRHLGWLGYDWSFITEPTAMIDGVNPIDPCTYHPHLTINDMQNPMHFMIHTRLGF